MVVLCTIKWNWENIILGTILCTCLVYFKIEIHRLPTPFCEYLASRANICLVRGKKNLLSSVMVRLGILYSGFNEGLPCNTLNRTSSLWIFRLLLLWFLLLLRPTSLWNKSCLILGIFVTDTCFPFVRVSLLLIPVLFEAPSYTIIRLKLKYLLFSYGTDTIKAGFSTIYGRF